MNERWSDADLEILERIRQVGDEMHSMDLSEAQRRESRAEFERLVDKMLEERGSPENPGPSPEDPGASPEDPGA